MASATAAPFNVVDFVRSLPDADKDAALHELVEWYVRVHGNKHAAVMRRPDGKVLAYFVPRGPAESILPMRVPDLTPEQMGSTRAAIDSPDNTFDIEELFNEASREDQGSS
jgi:hypothetical protein